MPRGRGRAQYRYLIGIPVPEPAGEELKASLRFVSFPTPLLARSTAPTSDTG